MKVIQKFHPNNGLHADPVLNLDFKRYQKISKDCYLFLGDAYDELRSENYNDKYKIYLTLEEPNFCTLASGPHRTTLPRADKILTLCPYTAQSASPQKRVPIYFPVNHLHIRPDSQKKYDVIYSGGMHFDLIRQFIDVIKNYNYRYVFYQSLGGLVTNPGASHLQKMKLYSQTKISVIHNLLFCKDENQYMYKQFPGAQNNRAMYQFFCDDRTAGFKTMPQLKSRVFQAAFSKSLILCYKDSWNIIQKYFQPEKQFLYFINPKDLKQKINYILKNYDQYKNIIQNAYNKAVNNYTTWHFVKDFIGFQ